ncbi:VOC family protein [Mucilaginibacter lappiensis]|jgi:predicted enzyme related to lactoylglutathione lyase|uniref:VOC family protein n=1 Tax=Mucilaginibacter lappiensis TaxID=354630 RepID=UPI003D25CD81
MEIKNHIGRLIILVNDFDEALNFYEKNFSAKVLVDYTTTEGQRFLHIGFDTADAIGIWFLKGDGERIGNQTAGEPTFVMYTNTLDALYQKLLKNGVKIKLKPVYADTYSFFHCYDLYGNEIIITELKNTVS